MRICLEDRMFSSMLQFIELVRWGPGIGPQSPWPSVGDFFLDSTSHEEVIAQAIIWIEINFYVTQGGNKPIYGSTFMKS